MKKLLYIFPFLFSLEGQSQVLKEVEASKKVYEIMSRIGYTTQIVFDREEPVISYSLGDSQAWSVNGHSAESGDFEWLETNIVSIKPLALTDLKTNLSLVTDEGVYYFLIDASTDLPVEEVIFEFRLKNTKLQNKIEKEKQAREKEEREWEKLMRREEIRLKNELLKNEAQINPPRVKVEHDPLLYLKKYATQFNKSYQGKGRPGLAPEYIFDDGRQTFLAFNKQRIRPAIFYKNLSGNETIAERTDLENFIVIHGVFEYLVLRAEGQVLAIRNKNYGKLTPVVKDGFKLKERKVIHERNS